MIKSDRAATRKTSLHHDQDADDAAYWRTKTVEERMAGLEALRLKTYIEEQAKLGNVVTALPIMQKVVCVIRLKNKKPGE